MTELEKDVLAALNELDSTVKSMATANPKPRLEPLLARVDELTLKMPRDCDPNLLHYLNRKSYEKARLLLQGRDAESARGVCGE
jgi:hypothetical protein